MKTCLRSARSAQCSGVTLIELVIVIAIAGIIGALVVQFVMPVRSYIDSSRRAALADAADTALRRIARDLRLALPNSVRTNGSYVEFVLGRTGGRYRYEPTSSGITTNGCPDGSGVASAEDVLSFSAADTCFKTIGNIPNISQVSAVSDTVVVFNLSPGTTNADVYEYSLTGGNKSQLVTVTALTGEDRVQFASNTFVYESPGRRFFIVEGPVTYGCAGGNLSRYWDYGFNSSQAPAAPGGTSALMATGATCSFTYDTTSQGDGLVTMKLTLTVQISQGGSESVTLHHAVHVNNVP